MSDYEIEKEEDRSITDDADDFLKTVGVLALIGGGLLTYWLLTSPKGQTFIGGGLAASGAKMIRDNWNK